MAHWHTLPGTRKCFFLVVNRVIHQMQAEGANPRHAPGRETVALTVCRVINGEEDDRNRCDKYHDFMLAADMLARSVQN